MASGRVVLTDTAGGGGQTWLRRIPWSGLGLLWAVELLAIALAVLIHARMLFGLSLLAGLVIYGLLLGVVGLLLLGLVGTPAALSRRYLDAGGQARRLGLGYLCWFISLAALWAGLLCALAWGLIYTWGATPLLLLWLVLLLTAALVHLGGMLHQGRRHLLGLCWGFRVPGHGVWDLNAALRLVSLRRRLRQAAAVDAAAARRAGRSSAYGRLLGAQQGNGAGGGLGLTAEPVGRLSLHELGARAMASSTQMLYALPLALLMLLFLEPLSAGLDDWLPRFAAAGSQQQAGGGAGSEPSVGGDEPAQGGTRADEDSGQPGAGASDLSSDSPAGTDGSPGDGAGQAASGAGEPDERGAQTGASADGSDGHQDSTQQGQQQAAHRDGGAAGDTSAAAPSEDQRDSRRSDVAPETAANEQAAAEPRRGAGDGDTAAAGSQGAEIGAAGEQGADQDSGQPGEPSAGKGSAAEGDAEQGDAGDAAGRPGSSQADEGAGGESPTAESGAEPSEQAEPGEGADQPGGRSLSPMEPGDGASGRGDGAVPAAAHGAPAADAAAVDSYLLPIHLKQRASSRRGGVAGEDEGEAGPVPWSLEAPAASEPEEPDSEAGKRQHLPAWIEELIRSDKAP